MGLPPIIEAVRQRPGMYVQSETFHCIASFVSGYDAALSGGLLVGFREWLIVHADGGHNLGWRGLVLHILNDPLAEGDQAQLIRGLFELLEQFRADRDRDGGLRRIFIQYENWLKTQTWYTRESPFWFDNK